MSETNSIDVSQIMADIRREIEEKGLRNDLPDFEEVAVPNENDADSGVFSLERFTLHVDGMNSTYLVPGYHPIGGNPIKVFFKKVLRKLMKFYVQPIAEEVTDFNTCSVRAMNQARNFILEQKSYIEDLEARVETLEAQVETLERLMRENKEG